MRHVYFFHQKTGCLLRLQITYVFVFNTFYVFVCQCFGFWQENREGKPVSYISIIYTLKCWHIHKLSLIKNMFNNLTKLVLQSYERGKILGDEQNSWKILAQQFSNLILKIFLIKLEVVGHVSRIPISKTIILYLHPWLHYVISLEDDVKLASTCCL